MSEKYTQNLEKATEYLAKQGAFLTVKSDDKINTMTIGWGNIGFIWKKPVFTVMVRKSRYTYDLIEKAKEFTVSIPMDGDMKEALVFCGTKSGRDVDKFDECNLKLNESEKIATPAVECCGMIYECKILYKQEMDKNLLDNEIDKSCYANGDYHTIYYGEIVNSYENK